MLNKALGSQQALAWDDEDGNLLIGTVGNDCATTALVWGENILTCDTEQSIRERFSEYQVAGQLSGDDDDFGEATLTAIRAKVKDSQITRYRPQHIQQSGNVTGPVVARVANLEPSNGQPELTKPLIRYKVGGKVMAVYGTSFAPIQKRSIFKFNSA